MKKKLVWPSTRAFVREARQIKGFSLFDLVHGYVYGRWTYLYIAIGTGRHPLARAFGPLVGGIGRLLAVFIPRRADPDRATFADTYHGKVVPLEAAKQLVSVQEDVRLGDLEQVIPYQLARDLVLHNPDHITVLDCPCRAAKPDACLPLDVCLIVGEPFASFVVEHHPERARAIDARQAQAILQAEDERGHVHHAFFKDAMFGRFYAICNCCSCCCGAMHAQQHGTPMLAASGYAARVDVDTCTGCGRCAKICPFGAIAVDSTAQVNLDRCMGCGVCLARCKSGALSLERAASKGVPLEIRALIENR